MISLTVSLIAVFIPLLFMSGSGGADVSRIRAYADHRRHYFRRRVTDFHADDVFAVIEASGRGVEVPGLAMISRGIDRMVEFYHRTLLLVLRHQRATLLVTFATIAATLYSSISWRPRDFCRCKIPLRLPRLPKQDRMCRLPKCKGARRRWPMPSRPIRT